MWRSYTILLIGVTPTGRFKSHAARAPVLASASNVRTTIPELAPRPGVLLCIFQSLRFTNSAGADRVPVSKHANQCRCQLLALVLGQKLSENHLVAV